MTGGRQRVSRGVRSVALRQRALTNVTVVSGVAVFAGAGVGQRALHVPPTPIPAHS